MLFELFITTKLQSELLSRDIFSYYNLGFKNNYKIIKRGNTLYCDFELKNNRQREFY